MTPMQVRPHPAVLTTVLPGDEGGDEMVLLHVQTNYYYSLNATGACIWQAMSHGRRLGEIAQLLAEHYAITAIEAEQAVRSLIHDLTLENLVQPIIHDSLQVTSHPLPNTADHFAS